MNLNEKYQSFPAGCTTSFAWRWCTLTPQYLLVWTAAAVFSLIGGTCWADLKVCWCCSSKLDDAALDWFQVPHNNDTVCPCYVYTYVFSSQSPGTRFSYCVSSLSKFIDENQRFASTAVESLGHLENGDTTCYTTFRFIVCVLASSSSCSKKMSWQVESGSGAGGQ